MSNKGTSITFRWCGETSGLEWLSLKRDVEGKTCSRSTEEHPIWSRIDGKGFTIYLSEVTLSNSAKAPPEWEVVVESLVLLNRQGQDRIKFITDTIELYLNQAGLVFEKI